MRSAMVAKASCKLVHRSSRYCFFAAPAAGAAGADVGAGVATGAAAATCGCWTITVDGLEYPAAVANRSRSSASVPMVSAGDIARAEPRKAKEVLRTTRKLPRPATANERKKTSGNISSVPSTHGRSIARCSHLH